MVKEVEEKKKLLKPCPFCGITHEKLFLAPVVDPKRDWSVICVNCSAEGPLGKGIDKAIELWNKAKR